LFSHQARAKWRSQERGGGKQINDNKFKNPSQLWPELKRGQQLVQTEPLPYLCLQISIPQWSQFVN